MSTTRLPAPLSARLFAPLLLAGAVAGCARPVDGFGIDGPYHGNVTITVATPGTPGLDDARADTVEYAQNHLRLGVGCAISTAPTGTQSVDADEKGGRDGEVDTRKDIEYDHGPIPGQPCTIHTSAGQVTFTIDSGRLVFLRTGSLELTLGGPGADGSTGYVTYRFSGSYAPGEGG